METSGPCGTVSANGFTVVPIQFEENRIPSHVIYIKEHNLHRDDLKPKGRTLFIANVPSYCTKEALNRIFSEFGAVQTVVFGDDDHRKPNRKEPIKSYFPSYKTTFESFKMAYVIFRDKSSLGRALNAPYDKPFIISVAENPVLTGVSKWQKHYKIEKVDAEALQAEVDQYMEEYDSRLNEKVEEEKSMEGVADDEGWIAVTKHGKMRPTPRTEINQKKLTKKDRKKKKERELVNFYTFQIKQEKQDRIANLRLKFEEDKKKIEQMKTSRKFKPY